MQVQDFVISSEECKLLLLLETTGSVRVTAEALRRDITVITRQIAELEKVAPVVEKMNGKWQISAFGKQLNAWSRDAILAQRQLFEASIFLRVAAPREFASRVFIPSLKEFTKPYSNLKIKVLPTDSGVEQQLLKGEADIAFACGKPIDPSIQFRRVTLEPFSIVASPRLSPIEQPAFEQIISYPYLQHALFAHLRLLPLPLEASFPAIAFQDWAGLRSACLAGLGWGVLPHYTVAEELSRGELLEIAPPSGTTLEPEQYGVWWPRERKILQPWVKHALAWLKEQKL